MKTPTAVLTSTAGRRGREETHGRQNRLHDADAAAHGWYRFVLSFPPHLVRDNLARFDLPRGAVVLDPFCGTGTTLVECKKLGIRSMGIEANPMAYLASLVKTDWKVEADGLLEHARKCAASAAAALEGENFDAPGTLPLFSKRSAGNSAPLRSLTAEQQKLILADSISPVPLHRTLVLLETLAYARDERFAAHENLALAKAIVSGISNLHFGPEVGIGVPKSDAPAVAIWLRNVEQMAADLRQLGPLADVPSAVYHVDAREIPDDIGSQTIDAVITSPPYPNEKDYSRTTRLESVLLGMIRDKADLQRLKRTLVRSNTRGVYREDDDDQWVRKHGEIERLATEIEERRQALGKTSGFERMYARVTKLYFGGMVRHLAALRRVLKPGARLAYVVGDQASYLRVMIRTGRILADIATSLGYEVTGIDLFRTRLATATREQLREEVLLLRWPGK